MAADTWSIRTNMPETRCAHAMARDSSDHTFVLRGRNNLFNAGYTVYNSVKMLDHISGLWTVKASATKADHNSQYTMRGEKVHLIGGSTYYFEHNVYNCAGDSWARMADLPKAANSPSFAGYFEVDDRLVYLRDNLTYAGDPVADTWTQKANKPRNVSSGPKTSPVLSGWMYCYMGYSGGATAYVDRFNVATNTWEQLLDAPVAKYHHTSVLAGLGSVSLTHVFGDQASDRSNYEHDTATDLWTLKTQVPWNKVRLMGSVAMDGAFFHASGGADYGSNPYGASENYVYETATPTPTPPGGARRWVCII